MTNCWATLGILPTQDIKEIHKARRSLIRLWHPDKVTDPQQKADYTSRCAAINVAHDEAIRLAATATRVLKTDFQAWTAAADGLRFRHEHVFSDLVFSALSPRAVLFTMIYVVSFRVTVPLTIFAFIFAMGLGFAAFVDAVVYLPVAWLNGDSPVTWVVLELVNVLVCLSLFSDTPPLFQAAWFFAIPLWRLRHWMKHRPLQTA